MNCAELLDPVLDIAIVAGRRIMEIYASDIAVTTKDDHSPLTLADLAAHQHIVAALKVLTPELPILSEEDANIPWSTRRTWKRYWLVDPLDGTREFIKRNDEFTVNIALIDDGYPVLGVVHAPALDLSYFAAEGAGAFRIAKGERAAIRVRPMASPPVFVVSRSHKNAGLEAFLGAAPLHHAISKGSSLKFCQIAAGEADLYPRTGPTSEWDTGAGQAVAELAGAQVLKLPEMTRLNYNAKESLLNPLFAVIGDTSRDWKPLLAMIA